MTEEEWLSQTNPDLLLDYLHLKSRTRKSNLFCLACCHTVADWLIDQRSRAALAIFEDFIEGIETTLQLERTARDADRAFRVVGGHPANAIHVACQLDFDALFSCRQITWAVANSFAIRSSLEWLAVRSTQSNFLRDIFGNPFRPVAFDPAWRTSTAIALAQTMYDSRDFGAMPILADALQDAGCEHEDILSHCRGAGPHVRGCWVVDLVLNKS